MFKHFNLSSLLAAMIFLAFSSCKAPEAYRKAATAFSQGSEIEMRGRFQDLSGDTPEGMPLINNIYDAPPADPARTADQYYQEAMKALGTALKGESQLRKLNIFDNALAIKALTEWRQGQYDAAKSTAEKALLLLEQDNGGEDDFRDLAMMQALPGLINIDLAFNALQETKELASQLSASSDGEKKTMLFEQIKQNFIDFALSEEDGASSVARALSLLQRAYDQVPEEGSLRLYFLNSQLAGLDSWGDLYNETFKAVGRSGAGAEDRAWIEEERLKYDALVINYLGKLKNMLPEGDSSQLYGFWKRVL